MLCQEEYLTLLDLHRQGWTKKEIAAELGYHPATIAKWLAAGGPPSPRVVPDSERVMTERRRQRIAQLLGAHPRLSAVSVFNKLLAEGFAGSYPTVVREVRAVRRLPRRAPRPRQDPPPSPPQDEHTAWPRQHDAAA
jgi:transcriptional regulator with XRE-family HTH domain